MQSVLSRHPILGSSNGSSQRIPRKSSSFLSLRKEKDMSPAPLDPYPASKDPPGPSYAKPTYFDAYPRPNPSIIPHQSKFKARETGRILPTNTSSFSQDTTTFDEKMWEKDNEGLSSIESSLAFPVLDSTEHPVFGDLTPKPYSRTRSRTGPSGKSNWIDSSPSLPPLRLSGTSTQHTETPLDTPIDITPFGGSFEQLPVVVAAPISGVETMDALVDNMNGGDIAPGISMSNRARFGIPGHHPLYQPPLPTPPPGVVLGGGKYKRKGRKASTSKTNDSDDEDNIPTPISTSRSRRRRARRPSSSRTMSNSTIVVSPPTPLTAKEDDMSSLPDHKEQSFPTNIEPPPDKQKTVVPSISEIIRLHGPPEGQVRSRSSTVRTSSLYSHSHGHATVLEEPESEPEPLTLEEETEILSRSSMDSVADEVQRTLRNQAVLKPASSRPPSSFLNRHSIISDNASICSPRSEACATSSIYSSSAASSQPPLSPFDTPTFLNITQPSPSQAVAQYLRSARLTTLLKLTRSPHASQDNPLTVSLSDLGSSSGFPVLVFLGLGCVRHVMGLYDEMAEILGLRLITIDRWGLGRTEPRSKSAKGIMQWANVVEEILDMLHIKQCSVMAHSAGAPYALSFANKLPRRIRGDICLMAPWVGGSESGGYKWLKYVPNGLLKTAQAAEWKLQAWMIGKPPTLAYEGIGYTPSRSSTNSKHTLDHKPSPPRSSTNLSVVYPSSTIRGRRPSMGSSTFSEYDDLGDFDGRFESRSTLGAGLTRPQPQYNRAGSESKIIVTKRKSSKGFLGRLRGSSNSQPQSPTEEKMYTGGKRLKALRSMGSLKAKPSAASSASKKSEPPSPHLPPPLKFEVGLGFDDLNWTKAVISEDSSTAGEKLPSTPKRSSTTSGSYPRVGKRRSTSFDSPRTTLSLPGSPVHSTYNSPLANSNGSKTSYQAVLGNALIAASHSESAKGTHNDLLQILNHENHSWGFSYSAYPHKVRVWYGDKDEKIAENAVRWMERNMGEERCSVKVVKGADHSLVYNSSVVVEILECVAGYWRTEL